MVMHLLQMLPEEHQKIYRRNNAINHALFMDTLWKRGVRLADLAWPFTVRLDFIRPGEPVENAYIVGFNGRFLMNV